MDPGPGLACLLQEPALRRHAGRLRVPGGTEPSELALLRSGADHHLQRAALLYLFLPVRVGRVDVHRFEPRRGRRVGGRQPLAHPAEDNLPARPAGDPLRVHHDILQGAGHVRRPEHPRHPGPLLRRRHHDSRQHRRRRQGGCLCAGHRAGPDVHEHHLDEPEAGRHAQELRDDRRARLCCAGEQAGQAETCRDDRRDPVPDPRHRGSVGSPGLFHGDAAGRQLQPEQPLAAALDRRARHDLQPRRAWGAAQPEDLHDRLELHPAFDMDGLLHGTSWASSSAMRSSRAAAPG